MQNLQSIMSNLAPRVSLTCWHTVLRRWCTKGRFGQKHHSHCTMGCDNQEDSIDHYAHCRVIRTWAQKRLGLHYDPLNSKHVWTQTLATTSENLHKQAHMIYAAYRATNHFRHAGTHTTSTTQQRLATEYLDQIIHEADEGNYKFPLKPARQETTREKTNS